MIVETSFRRLFAIACFAVFLSTRYLLAAETGLRIQPFQKHSTASNTAAIPPAIAEEARQRNFPLSSIKRLGERWIACLSNEPNAACIELGRRSSQNDTSSTYATSGSDAAVPTVSQTPLAVAAVKNLGMSDRLTIHQYGRPVVETTVASILAQQTSVSSNTMNATSTTGNAPGRVESSEQGGYEFRLSPGAEVLVSLSKGTQSNKVLNTLPVYRREAEGVVRTGNAKLVRQYIDAHPNEPFVVVVTVPALCAPCRQLEPIVLGLNRNKPTEHRTKIFLLEYFAFADAEKEVLGHGALFPCTLIYGKEKSRRAAPQLIVGNTNGRSIQSIGEAMQSFVQRGAPRTYCSGFVSDSFLSEQLSSLR